VINIIENHYTTILCKLCEFAKFSLLKQTKKLKVIKFNMAERCQIGNRIAPFATAATFLKIGFT